MEEKFLKSLIDNGFDFLGRAIQQFKTEPKYSVINFCAAIEILLKARLMHEHWSLVIATKGHPDIGKFKKGDFKSINFNELIPRIESVTGEKVPSDVTLCFKGLANHRNKMVHFFHEAHTDARKEELLEEIAVEQSSCWFFLRRLLEGWENIFGEYADKINLINASMKEHDIYLDTVFSRISPEINQDKERGVIFINCKRCKKEASEQFQKTNHIFESKCRVCLLNNRFLKVPCNKDNCSGSIKIEEGDTLFYCETCDETMEHSEISEKLETNGPVTPDDYHCHVQTNCALCCELDSVVENDNSYYICTNCFYFTQNDIGQCGWCSENQIGGGDLDGSTWSGCEFCDGQAGHMKDD
ncbi:MAG: hypothetical protein COB76_03410 [Alphaproteobacteria bacterium]|nr:MAG: hypothetical protein COB76_03410 [Alphaproteobacteria bacterium]